MPNEASSKATPSSPGPWWQSRILIAVFTFFPVFKILVQAIQDNDGEFALAALPARLFTEKIWGLGCIAGMTRCGVAWNTLLLAMACAIGCTALGLAFALVVTRTQFRYKRFPACAVGAADHHAAVSSSAWD